MTEEQVFLEFMSNFADKNKDGKITREVFLLETKIKKKYLYNFNHLKNDGLFVFYYFSYVFTRNGTSITLQLARQLTTMTTLFF